MIAETLGRAFALAERVAESLRRAELPNGPVVIGGIALGLRGHERYTADIDLAVVTGRLSHFAAELGREGFAVDHRPAGDDDPLGGLIIVTDDADPDVRVEIVNFDGNRLAVRLGLATVHAARLDLAGSTLPIADLPHLVALKLYALGPGGAYGAPKDREDLTSVLSRCDDATLRDVRLACEPLGLGGALAAELARLPPPKP